MLALQIWTRVFHIWLHACMLSKYEQEFFSNLDACFPYVDKSFSNFITFFPNMDSVPNLATCFPNKDRVLQIWLPAFQIKQNFTVSLPAFQIWTVFLKFGYLFSKYRLHLLMIASLYFTMSSLLFHVYCYLSLSLLFVPNAYVNIRDTIFKI